jgi:hypothetical protein
MPRVRLGATGIARNLGRHDAARTLDDSSAGMRRRGRNRNMKRLTGISLEYHLAEAVSLIAAPSFRHLERWTITVHADDNLAADGSPDIGEARVIVLNLESGMTPADLADETTGDWVDRDWTKGHGDAAWTEKLDESSVLILERLWINPAWRGNGLGQSWLPAPSLASGADVVSRPAIRHRSKHRKAWTTAIVPWRR